MNAILIAIMIFALPLSAGLHESQKENAARSWTKMSQAVPLGNKLVVWGGENTSRAAIYDVEKDTWRSTAEAPLTSTQARELRPYGIFGYNPTPPALLGNRLIVWSFYCHVVYDLGNRAWTEMTPSPISARDYHVSLLFGNT